MPQETKADFLGSLLFGNSASANGSLATQTADSNSQNLGLQANVASASIIAEKKNKNKDELDQELDLNIVSDNALLASTGPTGVSDGSEDVSSDQISVYVVREGDSIAKIAEMYGVSPNTILWANDMKKGDKLVKDTVLIILPIDGIKIKVTKGQTLKSISAKYKVDVADIAEFNGISTDEKLAVGDELIIPEATMIDEGGDKPSTKKPSTNKKYDTSKLADLRGYFMNPMPGARFTQGLHDHGEGIDLAAPKGTSIFAAAEGTVIFARNGYNGGYGNMVIISHPNGTKTLYGHMSKIATTTGARVSQGELIGYEGSTGRSTGPHLHFRVQGARNPGANLPTGATITANWKY